MHNNLYIVVSQRLMGCIYSPEGFVVDVFICYWISIKLICVEVASRQELLFLTV